jgi:hypothetical protein
MIWRIGDGENINIWHDPWLPNRNSRKPITPRGHNLLRHVSELINPVTGSWDEELVRQTFWEEDVKVILSLTVHEGWPNIIAWHFDNKGQFSVKSAYKVFREDLLSKRDRQTGNCSYNTGMSVKEQCWSAIWKLRVPGKIRHFMWRLSHNSHALKVNLERKGVDLDNRCLFCYRNAEDVGHLFFKCKKVKELWRYLDMEGHRMALAEKVTATELILYIMSVLEEEKRITIAVTLYYWWKERNAVREGEKLRPADKIAHCIQLYVRELVMMQTKPIRQGMPIKKWVCPPREMVKINCDGSCDLKRHEGGWGYIIRDEVGDVISAGCGRVDHLLNPFQAEVIACLQGAQAAVDLGISRAIIETDALQLCHAMKSSDYDLSEVGLLIQELRSLVSNNFSFVVLSLCLEFVTRSLMLSLFEGGTKSWEL